jgi:hypothetical protein
MQVDVAIGHCPGEAHFAHYGCGLPPCPCVHPCGHYPPHPNPYGRFEPPCHATERIARDGRSPSPIHSCKTKGKVDGQGEHGCAGTFLVDLDMDPHTPIPMTPAEAATRFANEVDVSISQSARRETPVWLGADNVIFKFQPLLFLPIRTSMYFLVSTCHLIF